MSNLCASKGPGFLHHNPFFDLTLKASGCIKNLIMMQKPDDFSHLFGATDRTLSTE